MVDERERGDLFIINVIKCDGEVADFSLVEITEAIKKAFKATGKDYNNEILELLSLRITADSQSKMQDGRISVEQIQDGVEHVLEQAGYTDVTKAYILYRKQREKIHNMKDTILDYKGVVNSYVKIGDWRVKEDSTMTYSVGGSILNNSGAVTASYWLSEVYDNEIAGAHHSADIHIHNLSVLTDYCAGWSLKQLLQEGLGRIPGEITSSPVKHLFALCDQMVNFLGIMQNEQAGAQTFSSLDTYLAPFVKADNLSYPETEKCIEAFIYDINTSSHWGTQAPFSNITLDWTVPNDMAELNTIAGDKEVDFKYKDCREETDVINKAFTKTTIEGDSNGRGFRYPIPTYSITRDFGWSDIENNHLLFEMTAEYRAPYFSSCINSDMEPNDVRSMCCRLRLDLQELHRKTGGLFGSDESTGSVGVVTINMPRIAYLSKDAEDFYRRLNHMMDISTRPLKTKREVIARLLNSNLYPYTKHCLGSFEDHFSTIGLIGVNEVGLNAKRLGSDLTHGETQELTKDVLNHMRERLSDYQEVHGDLYNLEATPTEPTTYHLAKHDRRRYPGIITAGHEGDTPYYTNNSHLPVDYTADVFDTLDIQDELQTLYTLGTVFRALLGKRLPDWQAAARLVHTTTENYKLSYYTLSPTYSTCKDHGYLIGEHFTCPICGQGAEVYSRITDYYRPMKDWNESKSQEYENRTAYDATSSALKKDVAATACMVGASGEKKETAPAGIYLFTTKICPNCRMVQESLENVDCQVVDAEESPELAGEFGIMQAPTPVLVKDEEIRKHVNTSNIKKFAETR